MNFFVLNGSIVYGQINRHGKKPVNPTGFFDCLNVDND